MKVIILAAGKGSRLRPLTDCQPKCMVPYQNKPIINHLLEVINKCNIRDIVLVTGYREDVLKKHLAQTAVQFYHNERFAQTNMVSSLFCAETEMNDDLIISYADYPCVCSTTLANLYRRPLKNPQRNK